MTARSVRTPGSTERKAGAAPLFTALGDETRLALIDRLCREGPMSISRLTEGTTLSRQAVAKHLRVLANAGLARGTARGRQRIWQLEARRLAEARAYLAEISAQWDAAIKRLQAFVERVDG